MAACSPMFRSFFIEEKTVIATFADALLSLESGCVFVVLKMKVDLVLNVREE